MRYRFGDFELDADAVRLTGPDGPVHLEPQVFDVVIHLVDNRDRVVTKAELLDEVWGSRFVSESALTSRIKAARSGLGDTGRAQQVIRTAHGKGYQFVAPVTEVVGGPAPPPTPTGAVARTVPALAGSALPPVADLLRGRERELDELGTRVAADRLVTILGPGGIGKTRLSIELAQVLVPERSVTFVDLAAVRSHEAIGQALAAALGIEAGVHDDVVDACCEYLQVGDQLLIVDNCEHVVDAAAALVEQLLQAAPTSVLATSRVPLGLRNETLYRLHPLPVLLGSDDLSIDRVSQNAAIALFLDRVEKVRHDFVLDESTVVDVVSLCRSLDGLPLALELAAGRMSVFGLDDLVSRLDRRLDLLGDDRSGADARHRTLRATLDWSYDLLDDDTQRLFRHLAVFPSGHTLEGIEWLGDRLALGADPLAVLEGLVGASLVGRVDTESGTRYTQLETMRAFGLDQLDRSDERDHAMDMAVDWAQHLTRELLETHRGPREKHWDDRLRRELPNIREARVHLARSHRWSELVDISAELDDFVRLRDVSEAWAWADELLQIDELSTHDRARTLAISAQAAWRRGRIDDAAQLATAAAEIATDDWTMARSLSSLGVAQLFRGEFSAAADTWQQRSNIDGYYTDSANAAVAMAYDGDIDGARTLVAAVRERCAEEQWPTAIAWSEYITGEIESVAGSGEHEPWLEAAVARASDIRSAFTIGVAGVTLSTSIAARGEVEEAARRYRELIAHWLRSGTWTQQWTTLRHAAALLRDHDPVLAIAVHDAADLDPYAPEIDRSPTGATVELRRALEESLDESQLEQARALTLLHRADLAERTRVSLAGLIA